MKLFSPRFFISHREIQIPSIRFYFSRVSCSIILPKISRLLNKLLYKFGLGFSLNRYENSWTIYSSVSDKKLYKNFSKNSIFCNFGSGAFYHNLWKNYDYRGQSKYYRALQGVEGHDFYHIDLCSENLFIPEKDQSVSLIYCSHTLEHITVSAAKRFLKECLRILKPSGVMRIVLPRTSTNFYYLSLLENQYLNTEHKNSIARLSAYDVLSGTEELQNDDLWSLIQESEFDANKFYQLAKEKGISCDFDSNNADKHVSFWNYERLIEFSKSLGFAKCIPLYRGSSFVKPFSNLNVFDTTEPHFSFYTELIK